MGCAVAVNGNGSLADNAGITAIRAISSNGGATASAGPPWAPTGRAGTTGPAAGQPAARAALTCYFSGVSEGTRTPDTQDHNLVL